MNTAREAIFAALRAARKNRDDGAARAAADARLARHAPNLVPARARPAGRQAAIRQFVAMAEEASATVARVASAGAIPWAVADYLRRNNLPQRAVITPDPALDGIPWNEKSLLQLRRGRAQAFDEVGIGTCLRAVAETGTLMVASGAANPATINFLPETHIVIVRADQIVGSFEAAIAALREASGDGSLSMPRTVNFITGPSRSADIEQTLQLGAHGPRRLHIILVDDQAPAAAAP